ncbi:hypothetical protein B0H14DRAFT_3127609 [Mycena olivaceomarginata]|nr:hypothetical protein B0H14DRAFT_3127609 [Mycena olivaceomarginata]
MISHPCSATRQCTLRKIRTYSSVSSFFAGASPTLLEKPGTEALDDVKKCFVAGGGHGQTGGRLNDARTTKALLGTSLDVKHPRIARWPPYPDRDHEAQS